MTSRAFDLRANNAARGIQNLLFFRVERCLGKIKSTSRFHEHIILSRDGKIAFLTVKDMLKKYLISCCRER